MEINEEKIRISTYFRKLMKLMAEDLMAKKMITKEDLYLMLEFDSKEESMLASPVYIKYKFSRKHFPRVRIKCEFISLKNHLKFGLKGSFSIKKPFSPHKKTTMFAKNYYVEEYLLD